MASKVYVLENLGCANCASKIERDVNKLPQVEEAVLVFATKQLRVKTEQQEDLTETIEKIARSYEPDITVTERGKAKTGHHHHHHEHGEDCCCGHDHEHEEHEHHHHHEHGEDCCCGHDHEHEEHEHHHHHEHGEDCCCGHDHEHEEHEHHHHHHEHGEDCCCGHDHEHEEHEHHHHHEHGEDCCCGHDHEHEEHEHHHHHEHGEDCCCGHDHEEHEHKELPPLERSGTVGGETRTYIIKDLDCANCGAKIERKLLATEGISDAVLTFTTKKLRVTAPDHDGLAERMTEIAKTVEPDVVICPEKEAKEQPQEESKTQEYIELAVGAICMVAGLIMEHYAVSFVPTLIVCLIGYIALGREVLWTAVRNMKSGHVFDENFLMSIATIGAFIIGNYPEACGVMLFFRIGEMFEERAVAKSRTQIMEAVDLRPETVQWEHDGKVEEIPAEEAEPEDILIVRPGDRVPLDGVVVEGESYLDTSAVTGEPVPVRVSVGDDMMSGCVNTSGLLKMRVTKPLSESMVTRILDAVENAAASKPKIDRFITRFARVYTPIVVAVAVFTAIVPSLITGNWSHWVYTALTFLVISCPCALVLSVPLAFFSGIGTASKRGILFKGGASLELLADIKAAALDKTGTMTKGTFTVTAVQPHGSLTEDQLIQMAASCEQVSTHPIAESILAAAKEKNMSLREPNRVQEIAGHGILAEIEENILLCGNKKMMTDSNVVLPDAAPVKGATEIYVACNGQFAGRILISDTMKPDAKQAIEEMHKLGIKSVMLTGDGEQSAQAIAEQTGVDEYRAHLLPEDKLTCLQDIRKKHGFVMFVGDGINDAPVLAGADVGAAMGSGADAAIEAADVVFLTGELSSIPYAVKLARQTAAISKQNIVFALLVKLAVMVLGLAGIASMWLAVFADSGVAMLCVLNSIRLLYKK